MRRPDLASDSMGALQIGGLVSLETSPENGHPQKEADPTMATYLATQSLGVSVAGK